MSTKHTKISFKRNPQNFISYYLDAKTQEKIKQLKTVSQREIIYFFTLIDTKEKDFVYNHLSLQTKRFLLKHLPSDELVEWIRQSEYQSIILSQLDAQKKHHIEKILMYHETRVGSMMQVDYVSIHANQTAGEILKYIISEVSEYTYMDVLWVVDNDQKLLGKISLSQVLIARKNTKIENVYTPLTTFLHPDDDITRAVQKMMNYDKEAIAVIVNERLVGIITSDDIFDELIESYEEDFQKLANIHHFDAGDKSITRYKKRMPWLFIALIINTMVAFILSIFENTLSQVTLLVLFQPLILGMSGNISTQALGVTLLSLDDHHFSIKKHLKKERQIGMINAFIMSMLTLVFSFTLLLLLGASTIHSFQIGIQVSLSLLVGMTVATNLGLMMPLLLKKFKKDPAVASGPLIATLNDFIGLVIYFSIATLFLAIL